MKSHTLLHTARLALIAAIITAATLICGCHHVDSQRLPRVYVHLAFQTQAEWVIHGVSGAGQYKTYIRELRQPADFPYLATSGTGVGGVLLCTDYSGQVLAYDLACPVECRADIRLSINADRYAECPKCHSCYDVFSLLGAPISGTAAERGYGLQRYYAGPGSQGEYMLIQ